MIRINYLDMTRSKMEELNQNLTNLIIQNHLKIQIYQNLSNKTEQGKLALEIEKISLKIASINYQKQKILENHYLMITTIENILKTKITNYYYLEDGTKILKDDAKLKEEKRNYIKIIGKLYLNDFIAYDSFKLMTLEIQKEFNYLQKENNLLRKRYCE